MLAVAVQVAPPTILRHEGLTHRDQVHTVYLGLAEVAEAVAVLMQPPTQ